MGLVGVSEGNGLVVGDAGGAAIDVHALTARCIANRWTRGERACASQATSGKGAIACGPANLGPPSVSTEALAEGALAGINPRVADLLANDPMVPAVGVQDDAILKREALAEEILTFSDVMKPPPIVRDAVLVTELEIPAEVVFAFRRLRAAADLTYAESGSYFRSDGDWAPAMPCCVRTDGICPVDQAAWSRVDWNRLDFRHDAPHLYQLRYESDGSWFRVLAIGDPGCNGTPEIWQLSGGRNPEEGPWPEGRWWMIESIPNSAGASLPR